MTPPAAGVAAGRRSGDRVARRRASGPRRLVLAMMAAAIAVGLAVVLTPVAKRAINDLTLPLSHADIIRQQAAAKQLDPALVAGVIYAESRFDPGPHRRGPRG